jgi:hypothetical protein
VSRVLAEASDLHSRVRSQKGSAALWNCSRKTDAAFRNLGWSGRVGWNDLQYCPLGLVTKRTPIGSSQSGSILPTADSPISLGGPIRMLLALTAVLLLTILITALLLMGRQDHPARNVGLI